jgi:hypothetical protein
MSDPNTGSRLTLGDALRALPPLAPQRDVWAQLAGELAVPAPARPRWRYAVPAALAASVIAAAAAFVVMRTPHAPAMPLATVAPVGASNTTNDANVAKAANAANATNVQSATVDTDAQLIALETRSQALERWLSDTRDAAAPLPGQDLAAAAEIEDLIGLVDVELADTTRKDAAPLWRRRVNLLEDLTALRYSNNRLAATALAASYGDGAPNRIN